LKIISDVQRFMETVNVSKFFIAFADGEPMSTSLEAL
jgi:hypothetical protein